MRLLALFILAISNLVFVKNIYASEIELGCSDRYLTLVNPVRARSLWIDKSLSPIRDQYSLVREHEFSATWLLQYDVLLDQELIREIKNFDARQEKGVFLEISKRFADDSRVIYPYDASWSSPRAIFLSGYSQSDRRRLIDSLFNEFKNKFGFFPKSVGTWWIDSYSLNYLKNRYQIKTAMIVADQKTTDNYGVWGQWWGVPYYPSKANILTPASNLKNKQGVAIIQWAQRDPLLAYGEGASYSNYSLQANDYINQGKNTGYFEKLVRVYLDCQNPLGQVTVGLETGTESVKYLAEYKNQLAVLKKINGLQSATMNWFADQFARIYPEYPKKVELNYQDSKWNLTTDVRINNRLDDRIGYNPGVSFKDNFLADRSDFLDRRLPLDRNQKIEIFWIPWFALITLGLGLVAYLKKLVRVWIIGVLFIIAAFGLIFRSKYQYGWEIYYGAVVPKPLWFQIGIVLVSFIVLWLIYRLTSKTFKKSYFILWLLPLSFGFDPLIQSLRYSFISDNHYLGLAVDALRFVGLSFSKPFKLVFVNQDFPAYQAAALLRFDFQNIWNNLWLSLIIYPLIHIIAALVLGYILLRLPTKSKNIILGIFFILLFWHLMNIFQADPRVVVSFK
jgi:hypothetical protein